MRWKTSAFSALITSGGTAAQHHGVSKAGDNQLKRVALFMDIRGCRTPEEIEKLFLQLDAQGIEYEILFLDAPDDVLMRRLQ